MSNKPTISTAKATEEEDTNGFTGFTQEEFLIIVNEPTISTAKVTEEDTNGFTGFTQEQFLVIVKAAQDRENGN